MKHLLLAFYFLSSNQADYDGKNLVFSGQFQVEHPMGVLKAEKATLKDLQLHGSLKQGTELYLEEGVSIESTRGKTPFTLHAQRGVCELPPNTLLSFLHLQELQFYDDVEILTLHDLRARGGSAFYKAGFLTLYPSFPSSHCHLFRGEDRIDAHEIRFDLFKRELVCLQAKGTLAAREGQRPFLFVADRINVSPNEQKLILTAQAPKRVLLWQEGFSLSAPEVHIQRDLVEGKGDVHFALDLEEQNIIEQLLSKYL